jgi:perosamine synthetase
MKELMPVAAPTLAGNEKLYVNECLDTTWISSIGRFIDLFETQFAQYCDTTNAISCSNGTVALHLALLGLGIGPGDEVLVPSLTYIASVNAIRYCGAEPVFIDSQVSTWNIDPADLLRKITPRTKAIIAVHLYGRPAPMNEIMRIAARHGLKVVEDAAEAVGATYYGQPVGSLGDVAAFSFFGNKIITCGEGGMVLTNDSALAAGIRQLKGQGQDPNRRYWFPIVGYNYRMTNIQAALGLAQLEEIETHLESRDALARWYRSELLGLSGITFAEQREYERNVCWLFSVVLSGRAGLFRDRVIEGLAEAGIETRPFFYPCHILPPYISSPGGNSCFNAEWLGARGISLPTWVGMTREHVRRVTSALAKAVEEFEEDIEPAVTSVAE